MWSSLELLIVTTYARTRRHLAGEAVVSCLVRPGTSKNTNSTSPRVLVAKFVAQVNSSNNCLAGTNENRDSLAKLSSPPCSISPRPRLWAILGQAVGLLGLFDLFLFHRNIMRPTYFRNLCNFVKCK
jgi:hypothetical protein